MTDTIFTLQDGTIVDAGTLYHDGAVLSHFVIFTKGEDSWDETFLEEEKALERVGELRKLAAT